MTTETQATPLLPEDAPAFYTTKTLAEVLQLSPHTVGWFRHVGRGPRYFRPDGARRVLYARADVEQWLADSHNAEVRTTA